MLLRKVIPAPYSQPGRWLVGHETPGMPGCWTVDNEALTEASARTLADELNGRAARAFIESCLADAPLALQLARLH